MTTCTHASAALAEPLAATAPQARTWLLVEQPGPWGGKALTSSHLDPAAGRALDRLAAGSGVRVALIRRPGPHADAHLPAPRRVVLAHTAPAGPWVRTAEVADPAALAGLDFPALGAGDHGGFGAAHEGPPLAFVCTNGRRDRCCALHGRPLAAELAASAEPGSVWEVTHLGGHRFAPTMLVLPHGYLYGRLTGPQAKSVLEAARHGRVADEGCRGRSAWDRPGQAAELAVRERTGEERADALSVTACDRGGQGWSVEVAHRDGRRWRAAVVQREALPPRPESCGAALGTPLLTEVTAVEAVAGGRAGPGT